MDTLNYFWQISPLICVNIILAISLNVINGYCGLFSLGHAGFFAVGAYAGAVFTKFIAPEFAGAYPAVALFVAVVAAAVCAGLAGLLIGLPCLRLTGDYLAIATVGFGEIIRILILNTDYVGGSRGLTGIALLTGAALPYWCLIYTLGSFWILHAILTSSFGRAIVSVRDDEIASRSMGINVRFYKTFSFVLGSCFAGVGGALFAHYSQFIAPNNFTFMVGVMVLLMIVAGGLGSLLGSVIGAVLVTVLPEALRFHPALSENRMLVFGGLMVLIMLWQPTGLLGILSKFTKRTGAGLP